MTDTPAPSVRLRADVLAVPAYRQGATPTKPGYKLSSNENPFPPLPGVLAAIRDRGDINRYAAAAMPDLRAAIAAEFNVGSDHVHIGAGSAALLYQLVQAAAGPGDGVMFAWPSFEAYPSLGLASGAENIHVPLNDRAEHDLDAMAAAVTDRTRVILLCSPNNPTGPTIRRDTFDRYMQRVPADTLVILDEAYREFVTDAEAVFGEEVLGLHPNLVVLRTFSKAYGLAGLRLGYAVGNPAILAAAASVAVPLSVTGLAESAALAALTPESQTEQRARIAVLTERRDALAAGLRELGLDIPVPQGNFVWIPQSARVDAVALAAVFAEEGTLVRPFPGAGVRISVGEAESVPVVLDVVRGYLAR